MEERETGQFSNMYVPYKQKVSENKIKNLKTFIEKQEKQLKKDKVVTTWNPPKAVIDVDCKFLFVLVRSVS